VKIVLFSVVSGCVAVSVFFVSAITFEPLEVLYQKNCMQSI